MDAATKTGLIGIGNMIATAAYTATAEAILVSQRFSPDLRIPIAVVNAFTGESFIAELMMKSHVLDEKFTPGFALGLVARDV